MPKRSASAAWKGGLKGGTGSFKVPRGNYEAPYSFASRFEEGSGMSPEDLVAAAHAACYSMAFAAALEKAGFTPEQIDTQAEATLEPVDGAPTISKIHLETTGRVPKIDQSTFQSTAEDAAKNCPVSRLFKGATITVSAKLQ